MAKKITVSLVILITFLAAFLRLYKLDRIPNGFFFDEATISYQAYSLIKTGKDTWENFLPLLSFRDYGEHILPVGVYLQTLPFLFGSLSVFFARLPHALAGALLIPTVFLIGKRAFSVRVGLFSAGFLALSPLALGWSRFVFEGNFGTLFFALGIFFLIDYLKFGKKLSLSAFFFGLSMVTYHIFLVTTPLFIFLSLFFFRKNITFRKVPKVALLIFMIFFIWVALAIYSGAGRARFSQAANLLTMEKLDVLNHQIGYCQQTLPGMICHIFLNKPVLYATSYLENYAGHFSPQFLFFDGTFLRRNILPQSGLMLVGELVIFYLGICYLFQKRKPETGIFLLWLAVYPFANSFTGVGEISRVAFAAPLFCLLSALGLDFLWQKNRWFFALNTAVLLGTAATFLINYFSVFPMTNAYYTNFGYDKIFSWVRGKLSPEKSVYISKNYSGSVPYISAMFFLPVNPLNFQTPGRIIRRVDGKGYIVIDQIENIRFVDDLARITVQKGDLVVATQEDRLNFPKKTEIIITDPTGRNLLIGYEVN